MRSDREGADPASVAFSAVNEGIDRGVDTVIVDTAGRLHTKTGLMDELGKIKRVIEKHGTVDEVLLVLDATTGQNGLRQARVFAEVTDITGIILTKLDGTAKGGIVIAVQRELGVPVKLVGLGEGPTTWPRSTPRSSWTRSWATEPPASASPPSGSAINVARTLVRACCVMHTVCCMWPFAPWCDPPCAAVHGLRAG